MYRSLVPDSVRTIRFLFGALLVSAIAFGGFFISNAHAAITSLDITSPNGSEMWRGTRFITWEQTSGVPGDLLTISLSADSGGSYGTLIIAEADGVAGTYEWDTNNTAAGLLSDGNSYRVKLLSGLGLDSSSSDFTVDNTAPVTTATPSFVPASTGWYNIATGIPTITLDCTDGAVGSGCNDTYYAWDSGDSAVYSGPLTPPEGIHTLYFYSDDNATDALGARNVEATNSLEVKVDTNAPAAPIVVLTDPVNAANQASAAITGTGEADASIAFSIDDTNAGTTAITDSGLVSGAGSIAISGIAVSTLD